jgi:hypothetical protein
MTQNFVTKTTISKTTYTFIGFIIALIISMVVLYLYVFTPPSLTQDTFRSNPKEMFIYLNSDEDIPPVQVSKDSTYYELRTDYGRIRITDYGTKSQIDKLRPIRAVEIIKIYNKLENFNRQ